MQPQGPLAVIAAAVLTDGAPPLRVDLSDGGTAWLLLESGRPLAFRNLCPHLDAPLDGCGDETWLATERLFVCSFHGATFASHDGRCIEGPCRGDRLASLEVVVTPAGLELRPAPLLQTRLLTPRPQRP